MPVEHVTKQVSVPELLRPVIEASIKSHGQHLQGVFPTRDDPPGTQGFVYTIGMAEYQLPELLVIGSFPPEVVGPMMNRMCHMMREQGEGWEDGLVEIGYTVPVKVRLCGPRAREVYTIQAGAFYNHDAYQVLQVMICDKNGVFQDDAKCAYGKVDLP